MKYERTEINPFLIQYQLKGDENKFDRLTLYNDLLFHNISFLGGRLQKSIIIMNELRTGGVIFANPKFIDRVFYNLKRINRDLKIDETRRIVNINKRIVKLSFGCKKQDNVNGGYKKYDDRRYDERKYDNNRRKHY